MRFCPKVKKKKKRGRRKENEGGVGTRKIGACRTGSEVMSTSCRGLRVNSWHQHGCTKVSVTPTPEF